MRAFPGLVALFLVATAAFAAERLSLRLAPGQALRYRVTNTTELGLRRGEVAHRNRLMLVQENLRTVEDVDAAGACLLAHRIERVVCTLETGGNKVEYDSARPEDEAKLVDPNLLRYAGVAGKRYQSRVAPTGRVLEVRGFDAIGAELVGRLDPKHPFFEQLRRSLEDLYADAVILRRQQATSEFLPDREMSPGDTWKTRTSLPNPAVGEFTLEHVFTFVGVEIVDGASCAHIVGKAAVRPPEEPLPGSRYAGGSARLERGDYALEAWLDLRLGLVRRAVEKIHLELTGEMPGSAAQTETSVMETEQVYLGDR